MNTELEKLLKKFNLIYGLALIALFVASVFLIAVNNYQSKVALAETIAHIVEEKFKTNQLREAMMVLSSARIDEFKAISYYKADGTRSVTFPPNIDPSYFKNRGFFDDLRYLTFDVDLFFDSAKINKSGTLKFSIDPYKSIPTAALFWAIFVVLLLPVTRGYKKLIVKNFEQESMDRKVKAVREVQRQIKHDSRGAIQAIKAVIDSSTNLDELELNTLASATKRLEGMISESSEKTIEQVDNKVEVQKHALVHIYTALNDIVAEKSAIFEQVGAKIECSENQKALSVFLDIDEHHFKRIISNILDNSIDAIKQRHPSNPKISITLKDNGKNIHINVADNGVGIRPENLPKIGTKGFTLKSTGSGLGLSWAKEKISEWQGELKVDSEYNSGTTVTMSLPIAQTPIWATDSISIEKAINVVAIDDDPSAINQWRQKFSLENNSSIEFCSYESGEQFLSEPISPENTVYLIDYDLGKRTMNGISIATKIENKDAIYMVTNNFDDWEVQRFCEDFGVKLVPKTVISKINLQEDLYRA